MSKIGLVVEGGGMKCAYGAGVLDRFLDENINFDYCIGVSAGSANAASFLARQRERNKRFYTVHVKDPKYISLRNLVTDGQIFGLQYIYGDMSNSGGVDPLDYATTALNPCEFEIVATDARSGKATYFNKSHLSLDHYEPIMASSALPVFCKPVNIDGHLYFDGGVTDSIPIRRAFEQGCEKVVVLLSKPRSFVKEPEGHRKVYAHKLKQYPETVKALDNRHKMYRSEIALMNQYEAEGKAFVFAPTEEIKMSTFTKDPEIEQILYDLGVKDFDDVKDKFLKFLAPRHNRSSIK